MSETPASRSGLILSVNAGSSSLKISLFRLAFSLSAIPHSHGLVKEPVELLLESSISNISAPPALFSFKFTPIAQKHGREAKKEPVESIRDHSTAFAHFLDYLQQEASIDRSQIVHVCHRVVHGGDYLEPVVITTESFHHIEHLSDLAPLHNGAALSVIKACIDVLPDANAIAYFDTSFHRSIPHHIAYYAINPEIAKKRGLKKYGFHGLSYAYIVRTASAWLQKDPADTNLLVMHLGSGASVCAIQHGKSLDTSMGLTPLTGLPGATRSGGVDPSLIFHYTNRAGRITHDKSQAVNVQVTQAEDILNKRSGWKALTGTTDFGAIVREMKAVGARCRAEGRTWDAMTDDEKKWQMAFDIFVDRVCDFVGAYYVKLGGEIDAVVFSGGIGEHSVELREEVVRRAKCLGFALDPAKNAAVEQQEGEVVEIGEKTDGGHRILVCRTDEQLEMARECAQADRFWLPSGQ